MGINQLDLPDLLLPQRPRVFTSFRIPSIADIASSLNRIEGSKSPGEDGISGALLKRCSHVLAPHPHALIGNMLTLSVYPDVFKLALLCPVHKTGSVTEMSNFRPISLLPVLK